MYPTYLKALTGFSLLLLTACAGVRSTSSADYSTTTIPDNNQHAAIRGKKVIMVGPPEYIPDTIVKANKPGKTNNKIIERGGRYVFMPPSYTMLKPEKGTDKYSAETLRQKIRKIKGFAAGNNYDTAVAFFIDMQVKSGKPRFFVVDLAADTIVKSGLVAHGKGNERFTFDRKFSNGEGSHCTSLGVYKIGKAYNGAFGLSYKLYGLNKTNSNALKRYVVLHSMGSIPDEESKYPITQTEGCPAVAPAFLEELSAILDKSSKSVLMYIYYGNG